MRDLAGTSIGRYALVRRVGVGSMGDIYQAADGDSGQALAVKVIHHDLVRDDTLAGRFEREMAAMSDLTHPAIIPLLDVGQQDDLHYIVMPYAAGGSLADHISRRGPMSPEEALGFIKPVASALDFAHERGVIHRDVKPENILLGEDGGVYLADFGLAKIAGMVRLTGVGAKLGTAEYMAPDWANEGDPTPGVDIYSVGIMLYEMLIGDLPYYSDNPMQTIMKHMSEPIPDVRMTRPELSGRVAKVVRTAMAKVQEERYASAGEMAAALERALIRSEEGVATATISGSELRRLGTYFYPNAWGRNVLEVCHQHLGPEGVSRVTDEAGLPPFSANFPPADMRRETSFELIGKMLEAVCRLYGREVLHTVSMEAGHRSFEAGMERFRGLSHIAQAVIAASSGPSMYRVGLDTFASFFQSVSDQVLEVQETETHYVWRIVRCPLCWGWEADEPVCDLAASVLDQAMRWASGGKSFHIVETECKARGDDACVFLIDKMPSVVS